MAVASRQRLTRRPDHRCDPRIPFCNNMSRRHAIRTPPWAPQHDCKQSTPPLQSTAQQAGTPATVTVLPCVKRLGVASHCCTVPNTCISVHAPYARSPTQLSRSRCHACTRTQQIHSSTLCQPAPHSPQHAPPPPQIRPPAAFLPPPEQLPPQPGPPLRHRGRRHAPPQPPPLPSEAQHCSRKPCTHVCPANERPHLPGQEEMAMANHDSSRRSAAQLNIEAACPGHELLPHPGCQRRVSP